MLLCLQQQTCLALGKSQASECPPQFFALQALPVGAHTLLQEAQQALAQCLWDYRAREREDLLQLLADDDAAFLRAFDLPQEAYARVAQSIIDICIRWDWL